MGAVASICVEPMKRRRAEKDLDEKVSAALRERAQSKKKTFRSLNSITMRLPRFKEGLRDIKDVFDHYDENSNGTIDNDELRNCLNKLQVQMSEAEADDIHRYCDVDHRNGIQFPEFVVLLCLMYLLFGPDVTRRVSEFESAKLNYVFDELIDAFLFFDKDGDGKMSRKHVTRRMNETSHQERTPGHITARLFKEMDLDRNGKVNLKEFLFAMIRWAGLETEDDGSDETSPSSKKTWTRRLQARNGAETREPQQCSDEEGGAQIGRRSLRSTPQRRLAELQQRQQHMAAQRSAATARAPGSAATGVGREGSG